MTIFDNWINRQYLNMKYASDLSLTVKAQWVETELERVYLRVQCFAFFFFFCAIFPTLVLDKSENTTKDTFVILGVMEFSGKKKI